MLSRTVLKSSKVDDFKLILIYLYCIVTNVLVNNTKYQLESRIFQPLILFYYLVLHRVKIIYPSTILHDYNN